MMWKVQTITQWDNHLVSQPKIQSINPPIDRSIDRSINQSIHPPINQSCYLFITTTFLLHLYNLCDHHHHHIIHSSYSSYFSQSWMTSKTDSSSQVWCEGARIFMNPLGANFNLQRANKAGWKVSTRKGNWWCGLVGCSRSSLWMHMLCAWVDDGWWLLSPQSFLTHISYHLLHCFSWTYLCSRLCVYMFVYMHTVHMQYIHI